ncbi:hypothetical protein HanPSC8_Chr15g0682841 [Helianthus annuus]|nr:hypothetical protein HanPSC8_Chr15g0682841 [Helianthus annuus]
MPSVNSCANNSPISRFCCNRVPQGHHRLPTVRSNKAKLESRLLGSTLRLSVVIILRSPAISICG